MLEVAQNFEQVAMRFRAVFLIVPGLILAVLGLLVWLGGLRFKTVLPVVVGALVGFCFGFCITERGFVVPLFIAVGTAFAARFWQKAFVAILAAIMVAIFAFVLLTLLGAEQVCDLQPYPESKIKNYSIPENLNQTLGTAKSFGAIFRFELRETVLHMPIYKWVIIGLSAACFAALGFFFQRFASAFCWAFLGTVLIFVGMIILLLYKGTVPITYLARERFFYLAAFLAMVAFGVAEQLFLCQGPAKVFSRKKRPKQAEAKAVSNEFSQKSWRST